MIGGCNVAFTRVRASEDISDVARVSGIAMSVLVAEDNAIYQMLMKKLLAAYGYSVSVVDNGLAALEALAKYDYDIVFMDLQMPDMDGLEATRQIVMRFKDNHPTIIAMTASSIGYDVEACFEAGVDDYIRKPIKSQDIETILNKWCKEKAS